MSIAAMKQALEALEEAHYKMEHYQDEKKREHAITALRTAIEQAEKQEPVAWMVYTLDGQSVCVTDNPADFTDNRRALPLYTAPQPAVRKEPWGWLVPPYGDIQRNMNLVVVLPPAALAWRIPLYMGEKE